MMLKPNSYVYLEHWELRLGARVKYVHSKTVLPPLGFSTDHSVVMVDRFLWIYGTKPQSLFSYIMVNVISVLSRIVITSLGALLAVSHRVNIL